MENPRTVRETKMSVENQKKTDIRPVTSDVSFHPYLYLAVKTNVFPFWTK